MTDHAALAREWEEALGRRKGFAGSLALWTVVLEGWSHWPDGSVRPLRWSPLECRERGERGVPLAAESDPELPRDHVEELVGPVMEQLAGLGADAAEAPQRFPPARGGGARRAPRPGRLLRVLSRPRRAPARPGAILRGHPRAAGGHLDSRRVSVVRRHARVWRPRRGWAAPSLLPSLRRRLDRAPAPVPVLRELGIARPCFACWAKGRTRATSSRPADPATATSRAWIVGSAGTPSPRWWRTGA